MTPDQLILAEVPIGKIVRVVLLTVLSGLADAQGFVHADFGDVAAIEKKITSRTCAIMCEPLQGEGGFYPAPDRFLQALRALCDEHGIVMICDEIQTGFGRTGKIFAVEHSGDSERMDPE